MENLLLKRIKDWETSITSFRKGDVIPVDGPSGTAKMSKDDLLRETAENALAGNVANLFDATKPNEDDGFAYHRQECVVYKGVLYQFVKDKPSGEWDATFADAVSVDWLSNFKPGFDDSFSCFVWGIKNSEMYSKGFIGGDGSWQTDSRFNSIRIYTSPNFIYKIKNQFDDNRLNIRVFEDNNGVYTQLFVTNKVNFSYRAPSGSNYFIQVIKSNLLSVEPEIKVFCPASLILPQKNLDTLFDFTDDLFEITNEGGFLNFAGIYVSNSGWNSCLKKCEPGYRYKIETRSPAGEFINIRVFKKVNNCYEQIYYLMDVPAGNHYVYIPNDGSDYYLQVPYKVTYTKPSIYKSVVAEEILRKNIANGENLFGITTEGGYLNQNGLTVSNSNFDSCLLHLKNGVEYKVLQQDVSPGTNNIQLFSKTGDTYTQLWKKTDTQLVFTSPKTGEIYLQVVRDLRFPGFPLIHERGFVSDILDVDKILKAGKRTIKILSIGNSYSRDNFSYVPALLENICGINVVFGILYKGGCTLSQHYDIFNADGNYPYFDKYTSENGRWTTTSDYNCITALNEENWDIITLQQQSNASRDYTTYQPYLSNLINLLCQKAEHTFKLGWLLTMSYPTGYSLLSPDTSDEMYNKIVTASLSALADTPISFIIPCGTATQNARHTTLDSLGDFGHLSYDGLHLQEGVPCLISAYAAALTFMSIMGMSDKGVMANKIRPTETWVTNMNVPESHGTAVGVTDANCILAQKCAVASIKKPYEITTGIV